MSDELVFAQEVEVTNPAVSNPPWKILVSDDDQAVHLVTRLALGEFTFEGRKLQLFSAYNEEDTRNVMVAHPDMALVLLDVVMDTVNSGFDLVRYIRQDLKNKDVRIVMRTGQSGNAPEDRVIIDYDINDFKDKTELTVSKLRTTIISSLRALSHLKIIEKERQKLSDSRSYLEQLLNTLPSLVITINAREEVVLWNKTAERWIGKESHLIQGLKLWDITREFDPLKKIIQDSLGGHRVFEQNGVPFLKNRQVLVNMFLYPLSLGTEAQLIIRMDDATLNRKQEEHNSRSRRFQAMSVFTEGFSREMSHILDLAEQGLGPEGACIDPQPAFNALRGLKEESTKVINSLKILSKKSEDERKDINLRSLLEQTLSTLAIPESLSLNSHFSELPSRILGNVDDVRQSLLQVAGNALEALKANNIKKGTLDVFLERTLPTKEIKVEHPEAEDRFYWVVRFRDNGPGMGAEILERVFDPYFSTKNTTPGSGLGLSMVFNILGLHGGFVHVQSEVEKGTEVQLYWPEEFPVDAENRTPLSHFRGTGTILVCDDEAMMRQLASSILQRFGFTPLQASEGYSTLEIFQEKIQDIRLVIMDMLMPGMQGLELFRALKKIDPQVKVLLSSGFGQSDQVEAALKEGASGFLQKPYGYEKLGKKILEILDGE